MFAILEMSSFIIQTATFIENALSCKLEILQKIPVVEYNLPNHYERIVRSIRFWCKTTYKLVQSPHGTEHKTRLTHLSCRSR